MDNYLVTFAPPTPNGGLHVGHLSGPYLAADIFTRIRRLHGDKVVFVSYSDDYQSYMERKARDLDMPVSTLAAKNYKDISASLEQFNVKPDLFYPALNDVEYLKAVEYFRICAGNFIEKRSRTAPYCPRCKVWGFEGWGRGTCNVCGASSDHSQCEDCAMPPDITGLSNTKCMICLQKMLLKEVERECFTLHKFKNYLASLYKIEESRPLFIDFIRSVLAHPDLSWPIDRPNDVGVPCMASTNRLIHTWFAGIAGYYAGTVKLGQEGIWKEPGFRLACFIGFDCSFSHGVVYPALLKVAGIEPSSITIYTNAYLKLNGKDFSTSRNIAIWARDILEEIEPDFLRLYLASCAPEANSKNFDTADFVEAVHLWFGKMLPQVLEDYRVARKETDEIQESEAVRAFKDEWRVAASAEQFSIEKIAGVLLKELFQMYALSTKSRGNELRSLFPAWLVLSIPIMPSVSEKLLNAIGVSIEDASHWLKGTAPLSAMPLTPSALSELSFKLPKKERVNAMIQGLD